MSRTTIEAPFSETEIETEAERLLAKLMHVECDSRHSWNIETCRSVAPLTLEINALQKGNSVNHPCSLLRGGRDCVRGGWLFWRFVFSIDESEGGESTSNRLFRSGIHGGDGKNIVSRSRGSRA